MEAKPQVFTAEEVRSMRDSIAHLRQPGAYEAEKWMVSAANRRPDVIGEVPRSVVLRDIALRTTEQMPGVIASQEERQEFLLALVRAGVPEVMTSSFGRGHTVEEMRAEVDMAKAINPECKLVYGQLRSRADLDMAARAGYEIVQYYSGPPWIEGAAIYSGDAFRLAWQGEDWRQGTFPRTLDDQLAYIRELIEYGHEVGVGVAAALNLLAFATDEYVGQFCETIADAKPCEIILADGSSGVGPEAFAHFVQLARQHAPGIPISIHPHNMFDLGTACAVAAARAGATTLEVAINRYCSAAGQADLASTAVALEALYGIETGIDLGQLYELARHGERFTGYELAWHHPVTGTDVFNWGGGDRPIQQQHIDPLIHWCIEPELVGGKREWTITTDSGPLTMWDKLEAMGFTPTREMVESTLKGALAAIREQRAPISDDQLRELALSYMPDPVPQGSRGR